MLLALLSLFQAGEKGKFIHILTATVLVLKCTFNITRHLLSILKLTFDVRVFNRVSF